MRPRCNSEPSGLYLLSRFMDCRVKPGNDSWRDHPRVLPSTLAETGRGAIEMLQDHTDVDVVLMDIMMPDMDGYDTMRAIRKLSKFRQLPIIALTAKAMKGDREKCIEAGASDYISKPVDTEQLLAMLRVWLYR